MLLTYLEGKTFWIDNLNKIAESHSRKNLNIHPSLYPYWIDSLIRAVKENDDHWTPELERSWRRVLEAGVAYISSRYEKP